MRLSERLFVLVVILCSVLCDSKKEPKRKGRHLFALLGYLHGYKIGQDYALQYPSYLITPIVILPSINQQQSVSVQTGSTDENYQENGGVVQSIASAQIVSAVPSNTNKEEVRVTASLNDDIEIPRTVRSNIELKNDSKIESDIDVTLRQSATKDNNTIALNITEETKKPNNNNTKVNESQETNTTAKGPYPSAAYDNQMINSLNLTTNTSPIEDSQYLPPVSDNRWQSFNLKGNLSDIMSDDNMTLINEQKNNTVPSFITSENVTKYPEQPETHNKGPYSNPWYNNEAIDQLSITTNYYTNESPLPQSDRWESYSPMNKISLPSGFRPLAGLYYDGFLHRPLKKFGFIPQNYWN